MSVPNGTDCMDACLTASVSPQYPFAKGFLLGGIQPCRLTMALIQIGAGEVQPLETG